MARGAIGETGIRCHVCPFPGVVPRHGFVFGRCFRPLVTVYTASFLKSVGVVTFMAKAYPLDCPLNAGCCVHLCDTVDP